MTIPFSIFRFLAIIAFLGTFFSGIFITNVKAQQLKNADRTAHISEIEIKGTSDLESSQIMFLIESQVGEPLNRKKIRRDIHAIFEMNLFDALCHAFGTMATGGFSTYDTSVGAFNSAYVDYVITFFMVLAGTNFALLYLLVILKAGNERRFVRWKTQIRQVFKDTALRVYLGIIGVVTLFVMLYGLSYGDWDFPNDTVDITVLDKISRSIRYGLFQVVDIITTTGFGTHDFNEWNQFWRALLLGLMFIGGCA